MKKKSLFLAVIFLLILSTIGCGQKEVSFDDLVAYNESKEVFNNHKNYSVICTVFDEEGSTFNQDLYGWFKSFTCYADKDSCLYIYEYSDSQDSVAYEDSYFVGYDGYYRTIFRDGTERYSVLGYFMDEEDIEKYEYSSDMCRPFAPSNEESPKEQVKASEESDGVIYITTECNIEDCAELSYVPEEYEGAVCQYHYEFNSETKDVLSAKMDILLDEKTINFLSLEYQYDVEYPEEYNLMVDFAETTKEIDPNDSRTITMIYPNNDDKEYSITVNNAYRLQTRILPGYSLYSDREGKTPFKGSDANEDLVIYAISDN